MKALLQVCASLNTSYSPYSILDVPDGTSDDDLHVIASQILPSLYGDENTVTVDEDGVCWRNGGISRTCALLARKTRHI